MADIHNDIERRLTELFGERQRLQSRLAVITEIERELKSLLAHQRELIRVPKIGSNGFPPNLNDDTSAAAQAVLRLLLNHPRSKEQIAELLKEERFSFGDKSPARVIHFTLLNLKKQGLAEPMPTGEWRLPSREKPA
jgi:hypothetical protein